MPLCELRLPNNCSMENEEAICDAALKATLEGLNIEDKNDRESRTVSVDNDGMELVVSFGGGKDSQGKKISLPTDEQMKNTCQDIANKVKQFGIKKVSLEGWNASFKIRSLEKRDRELIVPERFKNGIEVKENIAIRMVFSPSVLETLKLDLENNDEKFLNILEIFKGEGSVEIQFPLKAESEVGVECDIQDENEFSDEEMDYILDRIEDCLDSGVIPDRYFTTIWVRGGLELKESVMIED